MPVPPKVAPRSRKQYGIVIDAGSSGSRVQIYQWDRPEILRDELLTDSDVPQELRDKLLTSVPEITQQANWTKKISPGVSSYAEKTDRVWSHHLSDLIDFSKSVVPKESWSETPIFFLATAGVRLLPPASQSKLLASVCRALERDGSFLINSNAYSPFHSCGEHVTVIDGETEGLYGWLALNYLLGHFNSYDAAAPHHRSFGFLDMGGASTQLAFAVDPKSLPDHAEDLAQVTLRSIDGSEQPWHVFVTTWLGFGANEARKRHIEQLVHLSSVPGEDGPIPPKKVYDPCLPPGAEQHAGSVAVHGIGDGELCRRTLFPLLLKHLPCPDTPCLFNGVHVPGLDFSTDRFVGVSEYFYTARDVFHLDGEYDYDRFLRAVDQFCSTPWDQLETAQTRGGFRDGNGRDLPPAVLKNACFKASWILSVLHEGFGMPTGGHIDGAGPSDGSTKDKLPKLTDPNVADVQRLASPGFSSADTIHGSELSWALGRALLYASAQVPVPAGATPAGIEPPAVASSGSGGAAGGVTVEFKQHTREDDTSVVVLFAVFASFIAVFYLVSKFHFVKASNSVHGFRRRVEAAAVALPGRMARAVRRLGRLARRGPREPGIAASIQKRRAMLFDLRGETDSYSRGGSHMGSRAGSRDLSQNGSQNGSRSTSPFVPGMVLSDNPYSASSFRPRSTAESEGANGGVGGALGGFNGVAGGAGGAPESYGHSNLKHSYSSAVLKGKLTTEL